MAPRSTLALLSAALLLGGTLAGCSSDDPATDPLPSAQVTTAPATEPAPEPSATPPVDGTDDALPPGFPDPQSLIGQESYDEAAADGSWHSVVGGVPLTLMNTFSACFDGGTGDICGYAISGAVPPSPEPQPTQAGLMLLLRATGTRADGSPTWLVLAFGEMARELLLSSTRAVPKRLEDAQFDWRRPQIEDALRYCLHKTS